MDGQSRTCIEWMCNDEYEPGSFDLTNVMSPPDHESIFHSMMNATPLGGDDGLLVAGQSTLSTSPATRSLVRLPSDPANNVNITPNSLVSLVQHMELTPAEHKHAGDEEGGAVPVPVAGPSLAQAVSDALSSVSAGADDQGSRGGLARVTSASHLSDLMTEDRPPAPRVRRPSISCPNSPPRPRRSGNSFFTPSVFSPDRPAEICREWQEKHPETQAGGSLAAAAAGVPAAGAAAAAAVMPSTATLASAAGMSGAAAQQPRQTRARPRPSRLRELNFLAPSSM